MASILVVDDERSIRVTVGEFLRTSGYQVQTVEDALLAEATLKERAFDVVLTDIVLPGMSGVELLRRVRTLAPETLVLIMTGEPTIETAVETVRAGAYDYLAKPVSKAALLGAIGRAVQVKELQDAKRRLEASNREYQAGLERAVQERTRSLRES
jgi:DNA-binding NtrC family response regulator